MVVLRYVFGMGSIEEEKVAVTLLYVWYIQIHFRRLRQLVPFSSDAAHL